MANKYKIKRKKVNDYYKYLLNLIKNNVKIGFINEFLIDNYSVIEALRQDFKSINLDKIIKRNKGLYILIENLLKKNNYDMNFQKICDNINNYQDRNDIFLTYEQIDLIPLIMKIILFNKCYELILILEKKLKIEIEVKSKIREIEKLKLESDYFDENEYLRFDQIILKHPEVLLKVNYDLRDNGDLSNEIFEDVSNLLAKDEIDFEKIIKENSDEDIYNTILIKSLISTISHINSININDIINKISKTEELLNKDALYKNMSIDTKKLYHDRLIYLTKNKDEYDYIKELLNDDKHIGFSLFNQNDLVFINNIGIILNVIITFLLTFILFKYIFVSNIILTILVILPLSKVLDIIFKLLAKNIFKDKLFNMDLSYVKESNIEILLKYDYKINSKESLDKAYEDLEILYKNSLNSNISLLLDADLTLALDDADDIINKALKKCDSLNKKYKANHFYFIAYKKDALLIDKVNILHQLLKTNLNKDILAENISSFINKVKYIALLNNNLDIKKINYLLSILIHPLNKAILNDKKTRVEKGYALVKILDNRELFLNDYELFKDKKIHNNIIYDKEIIDEIISDNSTILDTLCLRGTVFYENNKYNNFNLFEKIKANYQMIKENVSLYFNLLNKIIKSNLRFSEKIIIFSYFRYIFFDFNLLLILLYGFTNNIHFKIYTILFLLIIILISNLKYNLFKDIIWNIFYKFSFLVINSFLYLYILMIYVINLSKKKINIKFNSLLFLTFINILFSGFLLTILLIRKNDYVEILLLVLVFNIMPFIIFLFNKDKKLVSKEFYLEEQNNLKNNITTEEKNNTSFLSNGFYLSIFKEEGENSSYYEDVYINSFSHNINKSNGMFLYIKNHNSGEVYTNTYAPLYKDYDKYQNQFNFDKISYLRKDDNLLTTTNIFVLSDMDVEVREVIFENLSDEELELEFASFAEMLLDKESNYNGSDVFISSEYDKKTESLIAYRKMPSKNIKHYLFHKIIALDKLNFTYVTEKEKFIGIANTLLNPKVFDIKFDNVAGENVNPILSLRSKLKINVGEKKSLYLLYGYAKTKEKLIANIMELNNIYVLDNLIRYSFERKRFNYNLLGIDNENIRLFNKLFNYLYCYDRYAVNSDNKKMLMDNHLNKDDLWRFGISFNYPLVVLDIHDLNALDILHDLIRCYEYYKINNIYIDFLIINREDAKYKDVINNLIDKEMHRMESIFQFSKKPGNIFIIDDNSLNLKEENFFKLASLFYCNTKKYLDLNEAILDVIKNNKWLEIKRDEYEEIKKSTTKENLLFYNSYGGFLEDEYVITNNKTPQPWTNIIANKNFGSIITNTGSSYTYAFNAKLFKITDFYFDKLINYQSEGIKVNNKVIQPFKSVLGNGYFKFYYKNKEYKMEVLQFIPLNDNLKVYKIKITNNLKEEQLISINFFANLVLGENYAKTYKYLLTEYNPDIDVLITRNTSSKYFDKTNVYLASSIPLDSYSLNRYDLKSIGNDIRLKAKENFEMTFLIGAETSISDIVKTISKYKDIKEVNKEFKNLQNYYKEKESIIKINTLDKAFDYLINNRLVYQSYMARHLSKTSFSNINGGVYFKEELQDAINMAYLDPENLRKQIIISSMHQFREGDVLHYYKDEIKEGLRCKNRDDYLWLVYAICEYIELTGDFDLLDEQVSFATGPLLDQYEHERIFNYNFSIDTSSIYSRIILSLNKALHLIGRNGLSLIGGGDIYEDMNRVGIKGKGTSIWLSLFLSLVLEKALKIMDFEGDEKYEEYYDSLIKLKEAIKNNGFDGKTYLRAYYDNGATLGSYKDHECKIDLLSQSFGILYGDNSSKAKEQIFEEIAINLVDKNNKIVKLLYPAFKSSRNNPGKIMDYPEGVRANGAQDLEATGWYIKALIKSGRKDEAYEIFNYINPIYRSMTKEDVNIYKAEPYVLAKYIYSSKHYRGMGEGSWHNAASNIYALAIKDILGLNIKGDKLYIKPNVPKDWKEYEINYRYQDTDYKIKVLKGKENTIKYDTKYVNETYIHLKNDWKIHKIIVTYREN